jgi:hypothetical protein
MAKIKGMAIRGALKYVKESGHPGGIPAVVAALPMSVKPVFDKRILTGDWYPYEAYQALLSVIDRQLGRGDLAKMPELGHFAIRQDTGSVLKVISLFASPQQLMGRSGMFWSRYCDTGEFTDAGSGDRLVVMALRGFPGIAREHCHLLVGWLEGLALAVGARTSKVTQTLCVHRGDAECRYEGAWA